MHTETSSRTNTPISYAELERRWNVVRAGMQREGIDVLVASANNDYMGGYLKYLSDEPAITGYRTSLVYPATGDMTLLKHGPKGYDQPVPPLHDGVWRGPGRLVKTPAFATIHYTDAYEGEAIAAAIRSHVGRGSTIGIVGAGQFSAPIMDVVRNRLSDCEFVNASQLVDEVKMVKSSEELQIIRATTALQDAVMAEVMGKVRPGMKESDLTALARYLFESRGGEQGAYLSGSAPLGETRLLFGRHYQERVLEPGDLFYLLIEANGPGGYYAQLGRTAFLGKPPQWLLDEYAFTLEAQRYTSSLMVPGTPCAEIWTKYNDFFTSNGRENDEALRLHCHGQGYDIVERPLVRNDEPGVIPENLYFASHPVHVTNGTVSWLSENFIAGAGGGGESIHRFPQEIVQVSV